MSVRDLIIELLKAKDMDREVVLYSVIDLENIDTSLSDFEFISKEIEEIDDSGHDNLVYIVGN